MIDPISIAAGLVVGGSVGVIVGGVMKARQLADALADLEFIRGVADKRLKRVKALEAEGMALATTVVAVKKERDAAKAALAMPTARAAAPEGAEPVKPSRADAGISIASAK